VERSRGDAAAMTWIFRGRETFGGSGRPRRRQKFEGRSTPRARSTRRTTRDGDRPQARLHHPNIAQFLGWAHVPGLALVVELFERGSLEAYVPRDRPGLKTSLSFCVDMARAVEYLHGRRPHIVVHRDIKPPNFLVSKCLRIKLGDFGIARHIRDKTKPPSPVADGSTRQLDEGSTRRGPDRANSFGPEDGLAPTLPTLRRVESENDLTTECGTARFMAPEVASPAPGDRKVRYDHGVDVFSLSLVFYFVWERKLPAIPGVTNVAEHRSALEAGGRPQFSRTPGVVRDLIRDMWALNPDDRISASEVCERLDRCSVKSTIRAQLVLAKPPPTRRTDVRQLVALMTQLTPKELYPSSL